jgi:uncharacterized protein DUF6316
MYRLCVWEQRYVMSREQYEAGRQRQLVQTNGQWYFRTRERINVGPFPTLTHAVAGADELVKRLAEPRQAPRKTIIEFVRQRCASTTRPIPNERAGELTRDRSMSLEVRDRE